MTTGIDEDPRCKYTLSNPTIGAAAFEDNDGLLLLLLLS